ncbi:MAG TPA: hypothetical protein VK897_24835 [Anaerolineales bacterium]|nr:hypothetical protein [Anaerolineales bacterium]
MASKNQNQKKVNQHKQGGKGKVRFSRHSSSPAEIFPKLPFPAEEASPVGSVPETRKWCFASRVPVLTANSPVSKGTLKAGEIVTVRRQNIRVAGSDDSWAEILYDGGTGWVNQIYLDDYIEDFPAGEVVIPNPTERTDDAAQFMYLDKIENMNRRILYNLCGELCVAFTVKNDIDPKANIETVIQKWKDAAAKGPSLYSKNTLINPTKAAHLRNMLVENGYTSDEILDFFPTAPGQIPPSVEIVFHLEHLKSKLRTHYLIALVKCRIGSSGELLPIDRGSKIDERNHWIVVDKIVHNGKRVEIYNPFHNKRETYSFNEFLDSCMVTKPTGLWVPRKISHPSRTLDLHIKPRAVKPEVHLDAPPAPGAAQYMMIGGQKKTQLCGEFSVAYILTKSFNRTLLHWKKKQDASLEDLVTLLRAYGYLRKDQATSKAFSMETLLGYWGTVQPKFYDHYVGKNQPTGTAVLTSILRAYGYAKTDYMTFGAGLTAPATNTSRRLYLPSPGRIKEKLKTHFLIAGVGIHKITGKLVRGPNAVGHWVVVEKLEPVGRHYLYRHFGGNGGWVTLYNPFTNAMEEYSYLEFTESMTGTGMWDGLWVSRDVQPQFVDEAPLIPTIEANQGKQGGKLKKNHIRQRWPEKRMLAEIAKRIQNGRPRHLIPALLASAGSGWSKEEIRRLVPDLQSGISQPVDALEAMVCKELGIKEGKLPPHLITLLQEEAPGDLGLAQELAALLRDVGILIVGSDGKCRLRNFPVTPHLRQTAVEKFLAGLSIPVEANTLEGPRAAVKIANLIRPRIASRVLAKLEEIRARDVKKKRPVATLSPLVPSPSLNTG